MALVLCYICREGFDPDNEYDRAKHNHHHTYWMDGWRTS